MKSNRRATLLISLVIMLGICLAGFVMSSSAETNTEVNSNSYVVRDLSKINSGSTIVVGNTGAYPLEWQLLSNGSKMLLVSKYILAADAYNGTAPANFVTAKATLASVYSNYISSSEKVAVLSTNNADEAYTASNTDYFEIDEEQYNGYADGENVAHYINSPMQTQYFQETTNNSEYLFMLSAQEAQSITNVVGDEYSGVSSIVRRPNLYSFSVPSGYGNSSLDDRNWWLRSDSTSAGNKGVMMRVIRKDTTLYNSLSPYGLIGNINAESGSAWLRPGMNLSKEKISFMYEVKLKTSTKNNYTAASTLTDNMLSALQTGDKEVTPSKGNAWKPAYQDLSSITITNAKIQGDTATFRASGVGSNRLAYFEYRNNQLVRFGTAVNKSGEIYEISGLNDESTLKLFSYKVNGNDLVTSAIVQPNFKNVSLAQIGNSAIKAGSDVYLDGKKFTVLDANSGNMKADGSSLVNGNSNAVQNSNAIYLAAKTANQFEKNSKEYSSKTALQESIDEYTSEISNNIFLKGALLFATGDSVATDSAAAINRKQFFALSKNEVLAYRNYIGIDEGTYWLRDEDSYSGSKNVVPAFNMRKDNILMVNKAFALDVDGFGMSDVVDMECGDEYELTLRLPDEYNTLQLVKSEYRKRYNEISVTVKGAYKNSKELPRGYNSYISAIITDEYGNVVRYGRLMEIMSEYYSGEHQVSVDVDVSGYEKGYSIFVFNEISKDPPSGRMSKDYMNTKYATDFINVPMSNLYGDLTINGEAYSGETLTLDLSASNTALGEETCHVEWGVYAHYYEFTWGEGEVEVYRLVQEISGTNTECTVPVGYNDPYYYVKATVSDSRYEGQLEKYIRMQTTRSGVPTIVSGNTDLAKYSLIYYGDYTADRTGTVFNSNAAIPWLLVDPSKGNAVSESDSLFSTKDSDYSVGEKKTNKDEGGQANYNDKAAVLLSKYSLGNANYNRKTKKGSSDYNKWIGSDVQTWCKKFFNIGGNAVSTTEDNDYNVNQVSDFDAGEIEATLYVDKTEAASERYSKTWVSNQLVKDRFFLLSAEELGMYYYGEDYDNEPVDDTNVDEAIAARVALNINNNNTLWWLRSARPNTSGSVSVGAAVVNTIGYVNTNDVYYGNGMRPAFNIDTNKIALCTLAVGGKKSSLANKKEYNDKAYEIQSIEIENNKNYQNIGWKYTIKDKAHSSFTCTTTRALNSYYEIEYSGAKIGDNEYLSLVRIDSNGKVVGYSKILNLKNSGQESGKLIIDFHSRVPQIKDGETDYIINEQCNADYQTDYCSELKKLQKAAKCKVLYDAEMVEAKPKVYSKSAEYLAPWYYNMIGSEVSITDISIPYGGELIEAYCQYEGSDKKDIICTISADKKTIKFTQPDRAVRVIIHAVKPAEPSIIINNIAKSTSTADGLGSDESSIYMVTGCNGELKQPIYVAVSGGETVTITGLQENHEYYVTNISEWAWRYSDLTWTGTSNVSYDLSNNRWKVKLTSDNGKVEKITVTHKEDSVARRWLCGESKKQHLFPLNPHRGEWY